MPEMGKTTIVYFTAIFISTLFLSIRANKIFDFTLRNSQERTVSRGKSITEENSKNHQENKSLHIFILYVN